MDLYWHSIAKMAICFFYPNLAFTIRCDRALSAASWLAVRLSTVPVTWMRWLPWWIK